MQVFGYTENGMIRVEIDRIEIVVPDDMANRHRQVIAEWEAAGNVIAPYVEPVPPPAAISRRQFFQILAIRELITKEEALAAVASGVIPSALDALVNMLADADLQWEARMLIAGATEFLRGNGFVAFLGAYMGMNSEEIDQLWQDAFALH